MGLAPRRLALIGHTRMPSRCLSHSFTTQPPENSMSDPLNIFVYGTLKRGEVRENNWSRRPILIEWATVSGQLRDLGPYPALVEGSDLVLGELWQFSQQDLLITLETLDEIEGFGQGGKDLYVRRIVACRNLAGEPRPASTYFYGQPDDIATTPVVMPDQDGFCHWTGRR